MSVRCKIQRRIKKSISSQSIEFGWRQKHYKTIRLLGGERTNRRRRKLNDIFVKRLWGHVTWSIYHPVLLNHVPQRKRTFGLEHL